MTAPAPVLEITNAKLLGLSEGLLSLDGIRTNQTDFKPFTLDPDTTWLIASNAVAAQDALRAFERAKKALVAQFGIQERMPNTAENKEKAEKFLVALDEFAEKTVSVPGLQRISRASLKVGSGPKDNAIPPSVLAKLMPILSD